MRTRSRTKRYNPTKIVPSYSIDSDLDYFQEIIVDSNHGGKNPVYHTKHYCLPVVGMVNHSINTQYGDSTIYIDPDNLDTMLVRAAPLLDLVIKESEILDKIGHQGDFGLSQTIAEFDGVVEMFIGGIKPLLRSFLDGSFYARLKYGEYQLVKDLVVLCTDTISRIRNLRKERAVVVPVKYDGVLDHSIDFTGISGYHTQTSQVRLQGTYLIHGDVQYILDPPKSFLDHLLKLLDIFGMNVDLALFWDLYPLSFVINWFVDIGSTLEAIHPRSWYSPSTFLLKGYYTLQGTLFYEGPCAQWAAMRPIPFTGSSYSFNYSPRIQFMGNSKLWTEFYRRQPVLHHLNLAGDFVLPEIKIPDLPQLLETLYLLRITGKLPVVSGPTVKGLDHLKKLLR